MKFPATKRVPTLLAVVSMSAASVVGVGAPVAAADELVPLDAPRRLLDTRAEGSTAFAADESRTVQIAGLADVSGDASTAILNVTAVRPGASGFLTVYPCGDVPNASNVNYVRNRNTANTVIAALDDIGNVCIYSSSATDVIVDVTGSLPGDSFSALPEPRRILDTRSTGDTFDEDDEQTGALKAGETYELTVADRAGVGEEPGAVVVNVTAAQPSTAGFVTVWPCGDRPDASNLNYQPRRATANIVGSAVSDDGTICLYASTETDVIVDVAGALNDEAYTAIVPQRITDTRPSGQTVDFFEQGAGLRPADGTVTVQVADRAGIPSDATAVLVNVTAAGPVEPGFITVHARGESRPSASNLNYVPGSNTANVAIARLGIGGDICVFTSAPTNVIVDVAGYFTGTPPPSAGGGCPADSAGPEPTPPPIPPSFEPAQYIVGAQLPAGRYVMDDALAGCFWERLSGFGGTDGDIIAFSVRGEDGRVVVDVHATDVGFEFGGDCGTMTLYTGSNLRLGTIPPGSHVVNEHIVAGTYRTDAQAGCYWQRVSAFDGDVTSIIANDLVANAGQRLVTIDSSDEGFESFGACGTWTLI